MTNVNHEMLAKRAVFRDNAQFELPPAALSLHTWALHLKNTRFCGKCMEG